MVTLVEITEKACQDAYQMVDTALRNNNIEFSHEGHKYTIPNFHLCFPDVVSIASAALRGTEFHATEISYREMKDRKPEFLAVIHRDDETYTLLV